MNELTAAELRYECSQRGLSEESAKNALEIRLADHFTGLGLQANSGRFQAMEINRLTGIDTDESPAHNIGLTE